MRRQLNRFTRTTILLIVGIPLLMGCSTMKIEQFDNSQPTLKVEEFFDGRVLGYGLVTDRFGNLRREFKVTIDGGWDGSEFVLDERFEFFDGEKTKREWRITPLADGKYTGTAGDVIGIAQGERAGKALYWSYQIDIPINGRPVRTTFKDWMFLQPDGVLINRAEMKKWGLKLGTITIFFQPAS